MGEKRAKKSREAHDLFDPANVRATTRQFGVVAIGYLVASWAVETWPLLVAQRASPDAGLDPTLAIYGFIGAIIVWLGVEIWISQKTWAALVTFGLTTLFTIADLFSFIAGKQSKWWVFVGLAAAYFAFTSLKGARQIKAGRVAPETERNANATP